MKNPHHKTAIVCMLILSLSGGVMADSHGLALNAGAHMGLGYLIGSTAHDKIEKTGLNWKPVVLSCALFTVAWNVWRPEQDRREFWIQAVAVQVGGQIGWKF